MENSRQRLRQTWTRRRALPLRFGFNFFWGGLPCYFYLRTCSRSSLFWPAGIRDHSSVSTFAHVDSQQVATSKGAKSYWKGVTLQTLIRQSNLFSGLFLIFTLKTSDLTTQFILGFILSKQFDFFLVCILAAFTSMCPLQAACIYVLNFDKAGTLTVQENEEQ